MIDGFAIDQIEHSDDIERYLDSASGQRGDTRLDRVLEVYSVLRVVAPSDGWHTMPGVRDFSIKYAQQNPFVPPEVSRAEALLSARQNSITAF